MTIFSILQNDDLVFDTDIRLSVVVPVIDQHEDGLFHRIKREIEDWFPWASKTTSTTTTTTEAPGITKKNN